MSSKIETWRAMRREAKRLIRREGPKTWDEVDEFLHESFGVEPARDAIMGPELDSDTVRMENGKYVLVGE